MTQELDWSDLSKLQTRDGRRILYARIRPKRALRNDSNVDVIIESGYDLVLIEVALSGAYLSDRDHNLDVIHRPTEPAPKAKKKKGWVNIYPRTDLADLRNLDAVCESPGIADKIALPNRIACVPIEWEEEEPAAEVKKDSDAISDLVKDICKKIASNRERLIEAWIAETGLKPSESELVETRKGFETTFHVRRKSAPAEEPVKKPKTVRLWRPTYELYDVGAANPRAVTDHGWRPKEDWDEFKKDKNRVLGPLEYRDFEVSDE